MGCLIFWGVVLIKTKKATPFKNEVVSKEAQRTGYRGAPKPFKATVVVRIFVFCHFTLTLLFTNDTTKKKIIHEPFMSGGGNLKTVSTAGKSSSAATMTGQHVETSKLKTIAGKDDKAILKLIETDEETQKQSQSKSQLHSQSQTQVQSSQSQFLSQSQSEEAKVENAEESASAPLPEPEVWDGPLNSFNTYTSTKSPRECVKAIEESLQYLETKGLVDWELQGYNAMGRMYHKYDMSEYMVNVYIIVNDNDNDNNNEHNQSVIEIRRSSGDTFVHDEFFRQVSKYLQDKHILQRSNEDSGMANFDLSLALDPLSLDFLQDLPLLSDDFTDGTTTTAILSLSTVNELASSSQESTTDVTTSSTEHLAHELLDVVTNRWSYREVFRHSTGLLCQALTDNVQLLSYVASQDDIVRRLVKPLTEDLYDTLILRNVLEVVKQLLQYENPQVAVYEDCDTDITKIKNIWKLGPQHQAIEVNVLLSSFLFVSLSLLLLVINLSLLFDHTYVQYKQGEVYKISTSRKNEKRKTIKNKIKPYKRGVGFAIWEIKSTQILLCTE
ncbi:hypothetical protein RFI_01364 [Reticulomyxa filosa]|uniref:Uncharacterized protein n=1 Tax=Reticulomyxa filosa TaxID=46433 RepID=X6PCA6_RETFI|nr:hypothetical protein RFI_01364 [Reticulomyxa filosa]|eukprot:ETO35699.1 hypothetical protein RFI_01364 [Reticulomyxa filosa]